MTQSASRIYKLLHWWLLVLEETVCCLTTDKGATQASGLVGCNASKQAFKQFCACLSISICGLRLLHALRTMFAAVPLRNLSRVQKAGLSCSFALWNTESYSGLLPTLKIVTTLKLLPPADQQANVDHNLSGRHASRAVVGSDEILMYAIVPQ